LRQVHGSGLKFLEVLERNRPVEVLDQQLAEIDLQVNRLVALLHTLERSILACKPSR